MGLKKLAKSAVKSVSKTVSGATNSLSNLAENTVKTVGDIGTTAYKGAGNLVENTGNALQSAGSEIGKGVENVAQEVDRNKNAIIGTVLAPVTGGASLALAAEDDTSVGKAADEGLRRGLRHHGLGHPRQRHHRAAAEGAGREVRHRQGPG